ncbi:MAG: ABC transporter ATP-binding protein [Candidatus Paceibacterota bacterium]|jgi:ATP-binding cassette subfamily B protein
MTEWKFVQKNDLKQKISVFEHYRRAIGPALVWLYFLSAFFYLLGAVAGGVLAPIYYKGLIDSVTGNPGSQSIMTLFWLLFLMNIIQLLGSRGYEYLQSRSLSKSLTKISSYALSHLSTHSYQFFADHFAGSLVTKSKKFVHAFEQMGDIIVYDFLYATVSIVGIIIVLSNTSLILASASMAWFVLFFALLVYFTRVRIPLERQKGEIESKVTGVLSDIVTNVLNLKIFSSKGREEKYFQTWLDEEATARRKAWDYANHTYSVIGLVTILAQTSLVFLSILLWQYGAVTAGTIVLVMSYSGTLFSRLSGLGSSIRRFFDSYTNASEYADILNRDIEIKDVAQTEPSRIKAGEVHFDNVTFYYKQSQNIFKNFNLKINAGEKIGIIGTSGAGKTTITKLLMRFADVTDGSVKIDGQDIRALSQDDLRRSLAYVPQDPILFHRSLSENIAYARPEATQREIEDAAKLAHAHDFIKGLSHGYDTLVGERGIKLSGGERQRVAIARAILKNAPILILDEATSSLDSVSETHIKEALDILMQGRTTIVIAHRLSTIEKMDRIIVMEKGAIVEEGNHKDLLAKKGVYYNFWSHQNKGFIG